MTRSTITHLGLAGTLLALAAGTAWAVTLATTLTIHGHEPQLRAGYAVAVGDVTGDLSSDLIVGAPAYDAGQVHGSDQNADTDGPTGPAGEVLIYQGPLSNPGPGAPLVTLHGEEPNSRFGTALKVADVNGDDQKDLIVSAMLASGHDGPTHTGCVYIYLGPIIPPDLGGELHPNAEVCGTQYREHFGRSIETGDFDGNGTTDLAVGAPWYSKAHGHEDVGHPSDGYLTGAVYFISGTDIAAYLSGLAPEIHAERTHGDGWLAHYGENLLNVGRPTAESPEALMVFAPGADNQGHGGKGRAYVAIWNQAMGFEEPLIVIRGTGALGVGKPGFVGDLNGDGKLEIGVASKTDPAIDTNGAGGLYLINGNLFGSPFVSYSGDEANVNELAIVSLAAITGERSQDKFGSAVVALGDIDPLDGDGVADFAVGASWADGLDESQTLSGVVYLLSGNSLIGSPSPFTFKIGGGQTPQVIAKIDGRGNDRVGQALSAGDLIVGGFMELVIGAPNAEEDATPPSPGDVPGSGSNTNTGAVIVQPFQ